jgi:hypothetical protein
MLSHITYTLRVVPTHNTNTHERATLASASCSEQQATALQGSCATSTAGFNGLPTLTAVAR